MSSVRAFSLRRRALLLGAAACASSVRAQDDAPPELPRALAWPARIRLVDGRELDAGALAAGPSIVVFWSLTCPYCERHNARVEQLYRATAGTPLLVLGAAVDGDDASVRRLAARRGYTFANTAEGTRLAPLFGKRRIVPRTYVVERGARLVAAIHGEMAEPDVLELARFARPA